MLCFKDSTRFSTLAIEVAVVQFAQVHLVLIKGALYSNAHWHALNSDLKPHYLIKIHLSQQTTRYAA